MNSSRQANARHHRTAAATRTHAVTKHSGTPTQEVSSARLKPPGSTDRQITVETAARADVQRRRRTEAASRGSAQNRYQPWNAGDRTMTAIIARPAYRTKQYVVANQGDVHKGIAVTSSRTDLSRIGEGIEVVRSAARDAGRDPGADQDHLPRRGPGGRGGPAPGDGGRRLLLSGSYEQIRADTAWLADRGVTEIFYDLNWDPQVGSPDADPAAAVRRAGEILDALAPDR